MLLFVYQNNSNQPPVFEEGLPELWNFTIDLSANPVFRSVFRTPRADDQEGDEIRVRFECDGPFDIENEGED